MSAIAQILAGSPLAADTEAVVDLLGAVAVPRGLPMRLTVTAAGKRARVELETAPAKDITPGPEYAEALIRLDALATRWGHWHSPAGNVWWVQIGGAQ